MEGESFEKKKKKQEQQLNVDAYLRTKRWPLGR
jgi:hypothetical protein